MSFLLLLYCRAGDPGSNPGPGENFFFINFKDGLTKFNVLRSRWFDEKLSWLREIFPPLNDENNMSLVLFINFKDGLTKFNVLLSRWFDEKFSSFWAMQIICHYIIVDFSIQNTDKQIENKKISELETKYWFSKQAKTTLRRLWSIRGETKK